METARRKRLSVSVQLEDALREKEARIISSPKGGASELVVVTPMGNCDEHEEKVLSLSCSLQEAGHSKLFRALYNDQCIGWSSRNGHKVYALHDYVKKLEKTMSSTTLLLVVDAFDVVVQQSTAEILEHYDSQPFPILFGGERWCYDLKTSNKLSSYSTQICSLPDVQAAILPGWFLNSGLLVSTLGTLVRFLDREISEFPIEGEKLHARAHTDDQAMWSYWYATLFPLIGLDTSGKFLVNGIVEEEQHQPIFDDQTGLVSFAGKTPAVMHFNGFAKEYNSFRQVQQHYRSRCG
jgi:hypothetical protein